MIAGAAALGGAAGQVRGPVLDQIALPHSYYYRELYLPQLTSGPSSVAWTPDGTAVIYSMQGSLWRQRTDSTAAEQLTDDRGSDYQPDCSPDGRSVVFVRYDGRSMELMLLDLASRAVRPLTTSGAVNVEPRWSPDGRRLAFVSTTGTGHFLAHVAWFRDGRLAEARPLTPDRQSAVARYYYSPFDHAINPAWTPDGNDLLVVSNREIPHGTGDIVRLPVERRGHAPPGAARGDLVARKARRLARRHPNRLQQLRRAPVATALAAARRWRAPVSAHLRRLRQYEPALVSGWAHDRVHLQPVRQHRAVAD